MANITTDESFVSYPEVEVSDLEFGIILRSYKIRIKLASSLSDHVNFTPTFSNPGCSFIRQSVEIPCFLSPHHFSFRAQMETQKPDSGTDCEEEFCGLYLNLKDLSPDNFLLIKFSVNTMCECNQEQDALKNMLVSKDNFLESGNQPLTLVSSSCPVLLSKHNHDFSVHGLQQEYFLTIMEFDFSKASSVPHEAQRIMAKQNCSLQIQNHILEWAKPFDVTIKCKGGYSIGAHKNILSVRSPIFKSMLESDFQESRTNIIHVMDLNAPTMKIILFFMYTGELQSDWMEVPVEEIIFGADKYQLRDLLKFFDHLMITVCNCHNALRLAQLAERHSLLNAKESILRFIKKDLGAVFNESLTLTAKRV